MNIKLNWNGTGLEPETKEIKLLIEDVRNSERSYEVVLESEIEIGRSNKCQICLDYDFSVSMRQCKIIKRLEEVYIVNMGKVNPTFVNNNIIEECKLMDGDYIGFGRIDLKISFIS